MRTPTIHTNGTHPQELYNALSRAREAVQSAVAAVEETCPNGRDYYVQGPEATQEAMQEHRARMAALERVGEELLEMLTAVYDAAPKEGSRAIV